MTFVNVKKGCGWLPMSGRHHQKYNGEFRVLCCNAIYFVSFARLGLKGLKKLSPLTNARYNNIYLILGKFQVILFALQWHNCLYFTKTFIKAYFISVTKYRSYESRNKSQNSKPEIKFLRKLRLHISFLKTHFEFLLKEHPPLPLHREFSNRATPGIPLDITDPTNYKTFTE